MTKQWHLYTKVTLLEGFIILQGQGMPRKAKDPVHSTAPPLREAAAVAALIARSQRIVIAAGAGISVSCGIPDFRSEKVGLYTSGRHIEDGIPSAELFFDYDYFQLDPAPFYKVAKSLVEINAVPSKTHDFFRLLENAGKIRRIYTQNIDGLERAAGCRNVLQCHGAMDTFRCLKCKRKDTLANCRKDFVDLDSVPYCRFCRSGVLKPDIVFFGESCPAAVSRNINKDCAACDLVLVMGTSLKVKGPVTALLDSLSCHVPVVLINNELVTHVTNVNDDSGGNPKKRKISTCDRPFFSFAAALLGPCDDVVQYICETNEWTDTLAQVKENHPQCAPTSADVTNRDNNEESCIKAPSAPKGIVPVRKSSRKRTPRSFDDMEPEAETIETGSRPAKPPQPSGDAVVKLEIAELADDLPIRFTSDPSLPQVFRLTRGAK